MFKKTSRSRNIRRKIDVTEDEHTEIEQQEEVLIKKTVTTTEKKKKEKKIPSALSFGNEEGDVEEFQVKKTKASRNVKLQLPENLNPLENALEEARKQTLSYDANYIKELQASTPSLPTSIKTKGNEEEENDALLHEKFPSTMKATTMDGVGIPDAGAILAAKKKREQMRKGFNVVDQDDGFIPLNDGNDTEENGGSRLVREEDDFADDGEAEFEKYVGDKFTLNRKSVKTQEKERREGVRELIEEAEDENDFLQSEDMDRWEEDMMKYGGARAQITTRDSDPYASPPNYKPAQIPDSSSIIPSLSDVMQILKLNSEQVTESMNHHKSNLQESLKTIENSSTVENDLDKEITRGSNRYNYFQELTQYVNDLGEFLDAKFPQLEKLELEAHNIIAAKTEIVTSRRWQHDLDDLSLFVDVSQSSQIDEDMNEEQIVDEFGRVKELRNSETARNRRRTEKLQRIGRQTNLVNLTGNEALKEQALWTDDEMTDEFYTQKDTKLDTVQNEKVQDMLSDVGEEFKSLRMVKDKFEAWKTLYYDDYHKAYGSLSLPSAFEFYVRCELVTWDPFSDPMDFDSMQWHSILSDYGVSEQHEDPDIEMLNKVVEKSLIKKIKNMLDTLNVASSKEMKYAVQVVEQVSYYVDTHKKAYKDFTMEIVSTLEKQLSQFTEIIDISILKQESQQQQQQQQQMEAKYRFFWSQCKYLKTLMIWRRLLPKEQLDRLGNLVMNRIIAPILKPETNPNDLVLQQEALLLLSLLQK